MHSSRLMRVLEYPFKRGTDSLSISPRQQLQYQLVLDVFSQWLWIKKQISRLNKTKLTMPDPLLRSSSLSLFLFRITRSGQRASTQRWSYAGPLWTAPCDCGWRMCVPHWASPLSRVQLTFFPDSYFSKTRFSICFSYYIYYRHKVPSYYSSFLRWLSLQGVSQANKQQSAEKRLQKENNQFWQKRRGVS